MRKLWWSLLATLAFWLYAAALFVGVRTLVHHGFTGWAAKLLTMGGIAAGLLPWGRWLGPRIAWVLGLTGRAVLVACYLIVLMPIAAIVRLIGGKSLSKYGSSLWVDRAPLPHTLDASRLEY